MLATGVLNLSESVMSEHLVCMHVCRSVLDDDPGVLVHT